MVVVNEFLMLLLLSLLLYFDNLIVKDMHITKHVHSDDDDDDDDWTSNRPRVIPESDDDDDNDEIERWKIWINQNVLDFFVSTLSG